MLLRLSAADSDSTPNSTMKTAGGICLLLALLMQCTDLYPTAANGEHPGVCPIPKDGELGLCGDRCKSDADCMYHEKCCKTGCDGLLCQLPNDKPGVCPEVIPAETCPLANMCKSDSECKDTLKCCQSGCSQHSCQSPIAAKQL